MLKRLLCSLFILAFIIAGLTLSGQARPAYTGGLYVLQLARAAAYQVHPGDLVDVSVTYTFSGSRFTTRALSGVEVIKIGEPMFGNMVYLNLNVTPAQAEILANLRTLPNPMITLRRVIPADPIDTSPAPTWVARSSYDDLPL